MYWSSKPMIVWLYLDICSNVVVVMFVVEIICIS